MHSADLNKRLWSIGMLALPVLLVKLTAILLGSSGPAPAAAAATPAPGAEAAPAADAAPIKPIKPTERQLAAAGRIEQLRQVPFGDVPLYYEPVTAEAAPAPELAPAPLAPKFALHAVMTTARGAKALINGRPYIVGETIRDTSWMVQSIDTDARNVVLKDSAGEGILTIAVEKPM